MASMYCCRALKLIVCMLTVGSSARVPAAAVKVADNSVSLNRTIIKAKRGDTVLVADGVYGERVVVEPGIVLVSESLFGAVLDGGGRGAVVNLGGEAEVSGFQIRNGTIGVLSRGTGNAVSRCRIVENWGTGIVCVGHLPRIEDNEVVYNRGSGIQGWEVRATTAPAIRHNTIAYNSNHGISVGGASELALEHNIVAYNEQFGMKVLPGEARVTVVGNVFYGNSTIPTTLPADNYVLEPMFDDAKQMDFSLREESPCRRRSETGEDLGARLAY